MVLQGLWQHANGAANLKHQSVKFLEGKIVLHIYWSHNLCGAKDSVAPSELKSAICDLMHFLYLHNILIFGLKGTVSPDYTCLEVISIKSPLLGHVTPDI
jgi:hypothetical protein